MHCRRPEQKRHLSFYGRPSCRRKKVALAKTVMGQTEKLIVLYPLKDGMVAKTLFYYDEIAALPKKVPKIQLDKNELNMAKLLINNMTKPFVAAEFKDEYQGRLREAILQKIQGNEVLAVQDNLPGGNIIDLMEALQKSIEMTGPESQTGA